MDAPAKTAGVAKVCASNEESGSQNTSFDDDMLGSERLAITESEDENANKSTDEKVAASVAIALPAVGDAAGVAVGGTANGANSAQNEKVTAFAATHELSVSNLQAAVEQQMVAQTNGAVATTTTTTTTNPIDVKMAVTAPDTSSAADSDADTKIFETSPKSKTKKKKMLTLIDSESEEESKMPHNILMKEVAAADTTEVQDGAFAKKKISKIIDSDIESDEDGQPFQFESQDDADNDSEDSLPSFKARKRVSSESTTGGLKKSLKSQQRNKMTPLIESDSDEDKENPPKQRTKKQQSKRMETAAKVSTIIDSASSSASSSDDAENRAAEAGDSAAHKQKRNQKPMRASAKKALDEMQALQSEQQRLHREANISVPYHKPKAHNLKDFLKRHSNALPAKPIKMTLEEMEEYDKLMEQRRKEAREFFKSVKDTTADILFSEPVPKATLAEGTATVQNTAEYEGMAPETLDSANETEEAEQMDVEELNVSTASLPKHPVIIEDLRTLPRLDLSGLLHTEDDNVKMYRMAEDQAVDEEQGVDEAQGMVEAQTDIEQRNEDCAPLPVFPPDFPETSIREPKKAQLGLITFSYSPRLSGDPSMEIDLESGEMVPKTRPVDTWLQSLLATKATRKERATQRVDIVNVESGRIVKSQYELKVTAEYSDGQERKPGASYKELQKMLRAQINEQRKNRREELRKLVEKEQENKMDDEEDDSQDVVEDSEEIDQSVQEYNYEGASDEEPAPQKGTNDSLDKDVGAGAKFPSQQVDWCEDDEENNDDGSSVDTDDDAAESDVSSQGAHQQLQRKSRLIKSNFGTAESSDDSDDVNEVEGPTAQLSGRLFANETQQNPSDMENDIAGLCSGGFDPTQATQGPLISQMPVTQANNDANTIVELEGLLSGTFDNTQTQQRQRRRVLSSSDESADERKNVPQRTVKLVYSDDEENDEGATPAEEGQEYIVFEIQRSPRPERPSYILYDSDENEVEENQRADLAAKNFVENEAELSGSEVGSEDEDEQHMDEYDVELGDEDNIDHEQLQQEVGKIHARKMMDEDQRDVRRLQEMFVEDEERDGVGRERQFRWKNTEAGFTLDAAHEENANGEVDDSDEERDEHLMRKKRFEREQMLQENAQQLDDMPSTSKAAQKRPATFSSTKRLTIIKGVQMKKDQAETKVGSPFLIAKGTPTSAKSVRGSFLVSDDATLTKLAGLTKGIPGGSAEDGTAGTVSVKSVKPSNFVFTTLTAQEHEQNLKRKADVDEADPSSAHGTNFMKKPKKSARKDDCLIDQLQ